MQLRSINLLIVGLSISAKAWIVPAPRAVYRRNHNPSVETTKTSFGVALQPRTSLAQSSETIDESSAPSQVEFTTEEEDIIQKLVASSDPDQDNSLHDAVLAALPTLPPKLLVKLRQAEDCGNSQIEKVSKQLNKVLNERMDLAKETLKDLLNAGEIRKLDAMIGKASREGRLDVAFFNVLTMNLQDAIQQEGISNTSPFEQGVSASRSQILKHIFTRCQEEVEKSIPPGIAFLNKLLRTEQEAIRLNLYKHYLTPQKSKITSPDGKEIELTGTSPVLVPIDEFCKAIGSAILQIRTVEKTGGMDRESAAAMVESCRQVAKEARFVIGESYGVESTELRTFEETLQPVFRPESPDSPYIQGEV